MNQESISFSVVIPLFNAERFIARAVHSVLTQSHQDFEIIIVNDGSQDNSLLEAEKIPDDRIRIFSQENKGVSAARNRGIAEARNDLIAFLDADDEWLPDFLHTISNLVIEFPECGLFSTNYWFKSKDHCEPSKVIYAKDWKGIIPDYFRDLLAGHPVHSSAVVIKKDCLLMISGFPADIHFGEDENTWMRLALISKFAYCNKPLSIYHREFASVADQKRANFAGNLYKHSDFLFDILKNGNIPFERRQSIVELLAKLYYPDIRHNIIIGNRKTAMELLMRVRNARTSRWRWLKLFFGVFLPTFIIRNKYRP